MVSSNRSETQSKRELVVSKGKQDVIDVLPVICLSLNSPINSPSPNIDLVEGPQVLVEVLEQNINKTCDYESKKKFQVS